MAKKVTCKYCGNPMTVIHLGKSRFPLAVHTGKYALSCKMIRLNVDIGKRFMMRLQKFGAKLGETKRTKSGRVAFHGET